ncbi:hypothetical protein F5Y14DRAFT_447497 [Nemania sp. NC0429]|nr:hypothetical protein F5Y14DRAFT_447497 [Nemania sp. NC0429]
MPTGKGRKDFRWDGDAHGALATALARMHGSIKPDEQEALVRDMKASGFETTWEAIRWNLFIYSTDFTAFAGFTHFTDPTGFIDLVIFTFLTVWALQYRLPPHTLVKHIQIHLLSARHQSTTMASPTKPTKRWDDAMLGHLFLSIYDTVDISFTPADKEAIAAMMRDRFGHDITWNAIR